DRQGLVGRAAIDHDDLPRPSQTLQRPANVRRLIEGQDDGGNVGQHDAGSTANSLVYGKYLSQTTFFSSYLQLTRDLSERGLTVKRRTRKRTVSIVGPRASAGVAPRRW